MSLKSKFRAGANRIAEQLKPDFAEILPVLKNMGPQIQWIQSYVAGDKILLRLQSRKMKNEYANMPDKEGPRLIRLPSSFTRPADRQLTILPAGRKLLRACDQQALADQPAKTRPYPEFDW